MVVIIVHKSVRSKVLSYVRSYSDAHQESPSLGQIASFVGTTKPHIGRVLAALERDGALKRLPAPPRMKRRIVLADARSVAIETLRALGWAVDTDMMTAAAPSVPTLELSNGVRARHDPARAKGIGGHGTAQIETGTHHARKGQSQASPTDRRRGGAGGRS